jgi:pyruvate formate lyase activating enzyme
MDEYRHRELTGISNRLILDNLRRLDKAGAELVIRVPVVPGLTDDDENIGKMGAFVAGLRNVRYIVLLPYHETGLDKYRLLGRDHGMPPTPTPSPERMAQLAEKLRRFGIVTTIGG